MFLLPLRWADPRDLDTRGELQPDQYEVMAVPPVGTVVHHTSGDLVVTSLHLHEGTGPYGSTRAYHVAHVAPRPRQPLDTAERRR